MTTTEPQKGQGGKYSIEDEKIKRKDKEIPNIELLKFVLRNILITFKTFHSICGFLWIMQNSFDFSLNVVFVSFVSFSNSPYLIPPTLFLIFLPW